jgi:uncharacterized protein (DUF924 family)
MPAACDARVEEALAMTRNVYRNDPRTYAGDAHAQALSATAFDCGMDRELDFLGRYFLSMPLGHAEDLRLQERATRLAKELAADAPPKYRIVGEMAVEQTAKYLDVIRRFGRFPHRNAILGRPSTPQEVEFLKTWAELQANKAVLNAAKTLGLRVPPRSSP